LERNLRFSSLRIAIQNATHTKGLARRTRNYLAKQGYTNVYISDDSSQKLETTAIIAQKGDVQSANLLKNQLGIGKVESSSTGALDSDLTIRVGDDVAQSFSTLNSNNVEKFFQSGFNYFAGNSLATFRGLFGGLGPR
jgi:hypothetical protein